MEVRGCLHLAVTEPSQVGEARREVVRVAQLLGYGEVETGRAALVATEAATNLVKHAKGGGELLVRRVAQGKARGLEILAVDRGAGIGNLAEALRDGVSTAGSPGTGLGAIRRQSDHSEVWSAPEMGTVVLARLWVPETPAPPHEGPLILGSVQVPYPGEEVCGDAWASAHKGGRVLVMLADGLGHGVGASEAAAAATEAFGRGFPAGPAEALEWMHAALRPTRGAAVAVAEVRPAAGTVRYAGVGNIAGKVLAPSGQQAMVSHAGIVGHQVRKIQEFEYLWPEGALLVMHSDGLASQWDLARYPGLQGRDPAMVAAVLYRDFTRGRDDVTVVAARQAPVPGV